MRDRFGVGHLSIAAVLGTACAGSACFGQSTFDWNNSAGGSFTQALNWSPRGGPPGPLDTARFLIDSTDSTVNFRSDVSNDQLMFDAQSVHFDLLGNTYSITGDYPCATFGGALFMHDGTLATEWSVINGTVHLPDASTNWQNANAIYLGESGHLELAQGAQLITTWMDVAGGRGGSAAVVVSDAGSVLTCDGSVMVVGSLGTGSLDVVFGATVQSLWGEIGSTASGVGTVTVSDGGEWNMPSSVTVVGVAGQGTLNVQFDASVNSGFFASVGEQAGSNGDVLIKAGGLWTTSGDGVIGNFGTGQLTVTSLPSDNDTQMNVGGSFVVGKEIGAVGDVDVDGLHSHVDVASFALVGGAGAGDVTLHLGGDMHVAGSLVLGDAASGSGNVFLNGQYVMPAPPELTVDTFVVVGNAGHGTLTASTQGIISSDVMIIAGLPGSTGDVALTFGPTLALAGYLDVGRAGHGTLAVDIFSTASALTVTAGAESTGIGEISVNDATMTITDGALVLGAAGTGSLDASGGAVITVHVGAGGSGLALLGNAAGSSGTMTLSDPGTLLDTFGQLSAGTAGQGDVTILSAAELRCRKNVSPSNSAAIIGTQDSGNGSVLIDSEGFLNCVDGSLTVGFNSGSQGALTIQSGGHASSVGGFIGRFAGSVGTVHVMGTGSHWTSSADLTIGGAGGGTLTIGEGGLVTAPHVIVGANGVAQGQGTMEGDLTNHGTVAPGDGIAGVAGASGVGTLHVDGNYTQTIDATLVIDVAGTADGQHDVLLMNGATMTLGGTLEINLVNGFTPRGGEAIIILAGAGLINSFDAIVSPVPVTVVAMETLVVLTFSKACAAADLNCDGSVNASDLAILLGAWGTSNPVADINDDGDVNAADLALLLGSWT